MWSIITDSCSLSVSYTSSSVCLKIYECSAFWKNFLENELVMFTCLVVQYNTCGQIPF